MAKICRGPKLEVAFANFGYSSETDVESHHEMVNSFWVSMKKSDERYEEKLVQKKIIAKKKISA